MMNDADKWWASLPRSEKEIIRKSYLKAAKRDQPGRMDSEMVELSEFGSMLPLPLYESPPPPPPPPKPATPRIVIVHRYSQGPPPAPKTGVGVLDVLDRRATPAAQRIFLRLKTDLLRQGLSESQAHTGALAGADLYEKFADCPDDL